jgi:uncharacterized protein (TIGR03435 family)
MKNSLLLFLMLTAGAAMAQPAFEVATIKLAAPNAVQNRLLPAGPKRISILSMNLTWLIYTAYGEGLSTSVRVTGGPDWMNKTSFAIEGQAQEPSSQFQFRLMLRTLLEERFALKIHTEIHMGEVYALVLGRSDGKLGPNVEEWDGGCGGRPPSEDDEPATPRCLSGYRPAGMFLEGATMFSAAELLSLPQSRALLGTIVQDQTGLNGRYKMHLDFPFTPPRSADPAAPPEFAGPSLFTAVQEQWGLKLVRAKGPLKVIVVESAQAPTPN